MDPEEYLSKRPQTALAQLLKEDLDPLSVDELDERIALLQSEIERVSKKRDAAKDFRSVADSLFRK